MTPEIQQQLIDWLKNLGNLAAEELPTFVQEIATYGVYANISSMILFSIPLFFLIKVLIKIKDELLDYKGIFALPLVMAIIFLFIGIWCDMNAAIKAKCAPRLYAIERITKK